MAGQRSRSSPNCSRLKSDALNAYRRNSDQAYEGVVKVADILKSSEAFVELETELSMLAGEVSTGDPAATAEKLDLFGDKFRDIDGASKIASEVSKARRALEGNTADPQKAFEAMTNARRIV